MPCVRFCVNCSGVLNFCRIWRNVILSIRDTSTCPHLDWQGRETPSKTVRSTELFALWCSFRWKAGKGLVSDGWKHVFLYTITASVWQSEQIYPWVLSRMTKTFVNLSSDRIGMSKQFDWTVSSIKCRCFLKNLSNLCSGMILKCFGSVMKDSHMSFEIWREKMNNGRNFNDEQTCFP